MLQALSDADEDDDDDDDDDGELVGGGGGGDDPEVPFLLAFIFLKFALPLLSLLQCIRSSFLFPFFLFELHFLHLFIGISC